MSDQDKEMEYRSSTCESCGKFWRWSVRKGTPKRTFLACPECGSKRWTEELKQRAIEALKDQRGRLLH